MLIVTGTMEVPPEGVEAMKEAARVAAEATRAEKGCITYAFWQAVEQPTLFRVYEEWEDMDCLKAHGASAHLLAYRETLKEIGAFGRNIHVFEPGPMTKL